MVDLRAARALFDEFKAATNRGDLQGAKQRLSKLKLILTQLPGLPPRLQQSPTAQQELLLARDVLELAVFLSIRLQDEAAFERNYLQLSTYYTDTRHLTPPSLAEPLVVSLNLLRLLVQNRVAEFHTELETLSAEVRGSEHARLVTRLEQWLMEGAYNKVLAARQQAPDHAFAYFLEKLLATVRDEIASCSEAAYASLAAPEAKRLLLLASDGELAEYAAQRGWQLEGGRVRFSPPEAEDGGEVPALRVISNTLTYARELERIV